MTFRLTLALLMNSNVAGIDHRGAFLSSRMNVTPSARITGCIRSSTGNDRLEGTDCGRQRGYPWRTSKDNRSGHTERTFSARIVACCDKP
jgi:hypothetical protein